MSGKKVENEMGRIVVSFQQEEMLSKEFQHNIENLAMKLPTEREA
jgi:hypothetical protein